MDLPSLSSLMTERHDFDILNRLRVLEEQTLPAMPSRYAAETTHTGYLNRERNRRKMVHDLFQRTVNTRNDPLTQRRASIELVNPFLQSQGFEAPRSRPSSSHTTRSGSKIPVKEERFSRTYSSRQFHSEYKQSSQLRPVTAVTRKAKMSEFNTRLKSARVIQSWYRRRRIFLRKPLPRHDLSTESTYNGRTPLKVADVANVVMSKRGLELLTALVSGFCVRNIMEQKSTKQICMQLKETNRLIAETSSENEREQLFFSKLQQQQSANHRTLIECFLPQRKALKFYRLERDMMKKNEENSRFIGKNSKKYNLAIDMSSNKNHTDGSKKVSRKKDFANIKSRTNSHNRPVKANQEDLKKKPAQQVKMKGASSLANLKTAKPMLKTQGSSIRSQSASLKVSPSQRRAYKTKKAPAKLRRARLPVSSDKKPERKNKRLETKKSSKSIRFDNAAEPQKKINPMNVQAVQKISIPNELTFVTQVPEEVSASARARKAIELDRQKTKESMETADSLIADSSFLDDTSEDETGAQKSRKAKQRKSITKLENQMNSLQDEVTSYVKTSKDVRALATMHTSK